MSLVYKGSVKDIYDLGDSYEFIYSDRYSIFDWGEMPDTIPGKGICLASFAALFFDHLQKQGYKTHYIRSGKENSILVKKFKVLRPKWNGQNYDYSEYASHPTQALVPLEVIFRFQLGQGNSLVSRVQKNPEYLADLGFKNIEDLKASAESPAIGPVVEISTKLESRDRYLSSQEVEMMKILTKGEKENLYQLTKSLARDLKKIFAKMNCDLLDGKFEFAFGDVNPKTGDRELILVDSIGPDELRLTYDGQPLSKEFLRQIYTNSEWAKVLAQSKKIAQERNTPDWKNICLNELKMSPVKLKPNELKCATDLYQALSGELRNVLQGKPGHALNTWSQEANKILKDYL
jgi:phosphoribosylaminoimidazole-succinocarboxamide synthase